MNYRHPITDESTGEMYVQDGYNVQHRAVPKPPQLVKVQRLKSTFLNITNLTSLQMLLSMVLVSLDGAVGRLRRQIEQAINCRERERH